MRNRSRDRDVQYLEYEAYEGMAEEMMAELAAELSARHELSAIAIHHRVGRVEIGEPSVVIAVSSPHRAAALAACKEAIDTLKGTVPLWKKEVYEGGEEWIGQGSSQGLGRRSRGPDAAPRASGPELEGYPEIARAPVIVKVTLEDGLLSQPLQFDVPLVFAAVTTLPLRMFTCIERCCRCCRRTSGRCSA